MGWVVSVSLRPRFAMGKGPLVPIVREAGWASEPVWTQRLEEKILCPCRGSNPDRPVLQSVVRHYTGNPKQVNVQVVLSRTITQHTARCHNFGRSLTTVVLTACNLLLFSRWTLCADTALLHARPVWPHFLGLCLSNNNFQGTGPSTSYNQYYFSVFCTSMSFVFAIFPHPL
jgi:hypothetical protein